MAHGDLNRLKDLKIFLKKVTDENRVEQIELLRQFYELIKNWKDELPNLRDIFRSEEINWLISDFIDYYEGADLIIGFVARTGYKDEVASGEQRSLRTTPLHHVHKKYKSQFSEEPIRDLFKIYDRFDVNYTDELGWSHFHVACMSGCEDAVRKFLEFGQDPNIVMTKTGHSPLYLALLHGHKEVAELLLRKGAHMYVANEHRSTPFHMIFWRKNCDNDVVELFFKIMYKQRRLVEINTRDQHGYTPLHHAAQCHLKNAVELLMRKGADPNSVDNEGETPLHKIYQHCPDEESATFMKFYFDLNDEVDQPVKVDTRNKQGQTPLHWALTYGLTKTAEVLLRRGVDPNIIDKNRSLPLHLICSIRNHSKGATLLKKFFEICAEKHHEVHIDAHGQQGQTPLQLALDCGNIEAAELLLRNGADPTVDDDHGRTPLHLICRGSNDDESATLLKKFFDVSDELNRVIDVNALDEWGNPPLHFALKNLLYKTAELLLRRGANLKLIDKNRSLLLHSICNFEKEDDKSARFLNIFFEICAEKHGNVDSDVQDEYGYTLLHKALVLGRKKVVEVLLRNGANPNLVDMYGQTPLHYVCECKPDDESTMIMLQTFFDVSDEVQRSVEVDTLDKDGETPLHSSLGRNDKKKITELLLRRGADPNVINQLGYTPLHSIIKCTYSSLDNAFVERFFVVCDEVNRVVQVDVRDRYGQTPLELILSLRHREKMAEFLLRRGADPNLADENGMTYLHNLCDNWLPEVALLKTFFEINDSAHKTVQVDARDKRGRTPLQLAVTNLMAHVVEVLLDRGADLFSFIFPSESDFDESFEHMNSQVDLAYGALSIVEILEERGYELKRSDALTIMKIFAKFKFFAKSEELECWDHDEEFASKAKETMINPNLSFNDLIQLRPEEAAKLLTPMNYYKFLVTLILPAEPKKTFSFLQRFHLHLVETMSKGFFRSWALEPFLALTHNRLPILCCELIMQNLNNEDLYNICLAAEISANEENQNT